MDIKDRLSQNEQKLQGIQQDLQRLEQKKQELLQE